MDGWYTNTVQMGLKYTGLGIECDQVETDQTNKKWTTDLKQSVGELMTYPVYGESFAELDTCRQPLRVVTCLYNIVSMLTCDKKLKNVNKQVFYLATICILVNVAANTQCNYIQQQDSAAQFVETAWIPIPPNPRCFQQSYPFLIALSPFWPRCPFKLDFLEPILL